MDDVKTDPKYLQPAATRARTTRAQFDTIEAAAAKLAMAPTALRARCRRAAVREGRDIVAYLGGGVVAYKFGRTWRVKFPPTP